VIGSLDHREFIVQMQELTEVNSAISCIDRHHRSCVHATMKRLIEAIDGAETSAMDDSGIGVAVIGVRTDHWRQFVLDVDQSDRLLAGGVFTVTRLDGDVIFVVPVDNLAFPKVLDDEDQQLLKVRGTSGN
jgi:hypothetical protein